MSPKVRIINQWSNEYNVADYQWWYNDLLEQNYDVLIFNGLWEWEFYHPWDHKNEWKYKFEKLVYERGVQIYILHGTNGPIHKGRVKTTVPGDTVYMHFPLFWLYCTGFYGRGAVDDPEGHILTYDLEHNKRHSQPINPDTLFISLVNKAHDHRCYGMDQLARYKILTNGVAKNGIINYSWHDQLDQSKDYPFVYWKYQKTSLSDPYSVNLDSYMTTPDEQFSSAFNIVFESHMHETFWTEKTFTAILLGKPFLILGGEDMNIGLSPYGFEKFDEVIDYSIDLDPNYQSRYSRYAQNLANIKQEYLGKEKELYNLLKPKAEHNKQLMITILKEKKFIPPAIKELLERYNVANKVGGFDFLL